MTVKHAHLSALMLAVFLTACGGGGGGGDDTPTPTDTSSPSPSPAPGVDNSTPAPAPAPVAANVIEALQANPDYSIFIESLTKAGLIDKLKAPGAYTVFAPTNQAFEAMFTETNDTKKGFLDYPPYTTEVMNAHIMTTTQSAADLTTTGLGKLQTTLGGAVFKVDKSRIKDNTSTVIFDERNREVALASTDMYTGNGVIHTVSQVMLHSRQDLMAFMGSQPTYATFLEALTATGLSATLKAAEPFTVFAPSNDAFTKLYAELGTTKAALFADIPLLTKVVKYHLVAGRTLKAEVPMGSPITTGEGETFSVSTAPSGMIATDQRGRSNYIIATDYFAKNGVVHTMQEVMLPKP